MKIILVVLLFAFSLNSYSEKSEKCINAEVALLELIFDPSTKFKTSGGSNKKDEIKRLELKLDEECSKVKVVSKH